MTWDKTVGKWRRIEESSGNRPCDACFMDQEKSAHQTILETACQADGTYCLPMLDLYKGTEVMVLVLKNLIRVPNQSKNNACQMLYTLKGASQQSCKIGVIIILILEKRKLIFLTIHN